MADSADNVEPATHAEQRAFDPDVWGASPSWDSGVPQSVYDDSDLDEEHVPLARSIMPGDVRSD
jgi:hypothetical protein